MQATIWTILLLSITVLDLAKIINLAKKRWLIPYLFLAPHLPLLMFSVLTANPPPSGAAAALFIIACVLFQLYTTLRLHFHWRGKNESGSVRIGILYGGRNLIHTGLIGLYLLPLWYLICFLPGKFPALFWHNPYAGLSRFDMSSLWFVLEVVYAVIFIWLFLINGCLRIFFGSRNLGVTKRIFILLFMWVPFVQLYLAHIMCRAAKDEYLVAVSRRDMEAFTVEDDRCATKYPLVMVHGIGFRDLRFFNYWGRIPLILKKHGANVSYGHNKAWGSLEENARLIAANIDQVLAETDCEKVNLIAHSKGGLDCRYLISTMGYEDKVASLTTINTPHYGSELIDILDRLPDSLYWTIANAINRFFTVAGDDAPDCYTSSQELSPAFCARFNEENPDAPGVYYQSYGSVMKSCFSDSLLSIPYLLLCTCKGRANDGLVDVSSMKWGEFKGVLTNKYHRGISHGDMIDLKREDIKGFDVLNVFYEIVVNLKEMGF